MTAAIRKSFFYDMVAMDIFSFRNVKKDADSMSLAQKIKEDTLRDDNLFTIYYAQRVIYIEQMYFQWDEDVPSEIRALETWWQMVSSGQDPVQCYLFYIENIPNYLSNDFNDAVVSAHTIYKPARERMPKENDDPKLSKPKKNSAKASVLG